MVTMSKKISYLPESDSEDDLPPGWEEKPADGGHICFINQQSKIAQWSHPRTGRRKRISTDMPIGWEQSYDDQSKRVVYLNTQTKQSTFMDPRLAFAVEEPTLDITQVRQRFDGSTTALQILHGKDLSKCLAVVTGANAGIGFETARSLALHCCQVIFACRSRTAAEEAIAKIVAERPSAKERCRFMQLDLGSFRSVQNFIAEMKQNVTNINYLILNAGVFALPYTRSEDGLELTFQVSHLAHFHLTLELEQMFDHNTRIVVLSSESHRFANLPADKLTEQHLTPTPDKYWSMMAYNNAKLCNVLFAQELALKWKHRGISVFSVHPGNMVSTQISRNWWFYRLLFALVRPFTKSLQQAAATTIYCATATELTGLSGMYFNNCYFCEPSKLAQNEQLRQKLWQLSELMVKKVLEHNDCSGFIY